MVLESHKAPLDLRSRPLLDNGVPEIACATHLSKHPGNLGHFEKIKPKNNRKGRRKEGGGGRRGGRRGQSKGGARLIRVGETRLQSGEFQEGWRYANEPVSTLSPARSFLLEVRLWEELC